MIFCMMISIIFATNACLCYYNTIFLLILMVIQRVRNEHYGFVNNSMLVWDKPIMDQLSTTNYFQLFLFVPLKLFLFVVNLDFIGPSIYFMIGATTVALITLPS